MSSEGGRQPEAGPASRPGPASAPRPASNPAPASTPSPTGTGEEDQAPVLSVRHLVKRFGAVTAIDDVSLDIYPGEVLGIVGDNGAGKSTFLSLLSGYHHPDAGEFYYRGSPVRITSPARSRRELGIEMVYQDLAMAQDLTVWQNLFLGEERRRWGVLLDRPAMRARAGEALERMQTKIRPDDLVSDLSGGERQIVAMARGVLFDRDIVLLDEPTAAVSVAKADDVLDTIRDLHAAGKTVILISHRIEDVLAVCTRIAVFVTGQLAHVATNDGLTSGDLIHLMFGDRASRPGSRSANRAARAGAHSGNRAAQPATRSDDSAATRPDDSAATDSDDPAG